MARYRYNPETKKVEEITEEAPRYDGHYVVQDSLGQVLYNPCYKKDDPRAYTDSKSEYLRRTAEAGCTVFEPGMGKRKAPEKPYDVKTAFLKAKRHLTYKNDW